MKKQMTRYLIILATTSVLSFVSGAYSFAHKHDWKEISKNYYSPTNREIKMTGLIDQNDVNRLLYGGVIIILKCQKCGDIKSKEIIGIQP